MTTVAGPSQAQGQVQVVPGYLWNTAPSLRRQVAERRRTLNEVLGTVSRNLDDLGWLAGRGRVEPRGGIPAGRV